MHGKQAWSVLEASETSGAKRRMNKDKPCPKCDEYGTSEVITLLVDEISPLTLLRCKNCGTKWKLLGNNKLEIITIVHLGPSTDI